MPTVLLSTLFVLVPAPVSRVALVVMLVVVVVVVDELLTLSTALASLAGAPIDMLAPRSLVVMLLTVGWRWQAETESAAPATRGVRMKSLRMMESSVHEYQPPIPPNRRAFKSGVPNLKTGEFPNSGT